MVRLWWLWWPQPLMAVRHSVTSIGWASARHPEGLRRHSQSPHGWRCDEGVSGVMRWIGMMEMAWWQRCLRRKKVGVCRKNPPEKFSDGGAGQWWLPEIGKEGESV
ncbi:hypothetical protein Tco_1578712 [Tanacetum coccineum]